jgi:hypothetical protein
MTGGQSRAEGAENPYDDAFQAPVRVLRALALTV